MCGSDMDKGPSLTLPWSMPPSAASAGPRLSPGGFVRFEAGMER